METKEVKVIENNAIEFERTDYKAKAMEYLSSMGNTLPPAIQTQFLELAQAYHLNPFKRQIYAVGYGNKWNVITGYEVYLQRAEYLKKLDGWEVTVSGKGQEMTATVTIWRKDWTHPFTHTVLFSEVCQKTKDKNTQEERLTSMWAKMPTFMCKKVAIAQAFRLCFPEEMGGMPYTSDEIANDENLRDVTPQVEVSIQDAPAPSLFTKEQALEIKELVETHSEDGKPYFSESEKEYLRILLRSGEFGRAKSQALKTLEAKKEAEAERRILDDIADEIF